MPIHRFDPLILSALKIRRRTRQFEPPSARETPKDFLVASRGQRAEIRITVARPRRVKDASVLLTRKRKEPRDYALIPCKSGPNHRVECESTGAAISPDVSSRQSAIISPRAVGENLQFAPLKLNPP